MRRLRPPSGRRDEGGAILVLITGFTVVLVAMAALVIDIGSIVDEKRQLQNGADAAALAIAQSCAFGTCNDGLAATLANANSRDSRSDAQVTYPAAKRVTVRTTTSSGGTAILPFHFGQALTGIKGKTVHATATAGWGYIGRATALRMAISQCDVRRVEAAGFNVESILNFHSTVPGCDSSSGTDASGAFGFLDDDRVGNNCELTVTVNQTATADPGTSGPGQCVAPRINTDVLLVVFDDVIGIVGTGTNARYTVRGFARFHITGYRFGSISSTPAPCSGSTTCIKGYFSRFISPGELIDGTVEGGDFGAVTVNLIS
jgi:hypothetical protein